MENTTKPHFEPKATGSSNIWMRIRYIARIPKYRTIPAMLLGVSVYLAAFNIGVRYWKGENHPINRYQWQKLVESGTLPEELKAKEDVILSYYKSRIFNTSESPQQFR